METSTLKLEASWDEVKEKMKENDIRLTDEDLVYSPGKENQLLDHLAKKLGKDRSAVKAYIESISSNKGKAS